MDYCCDMETCSGARSEEESKRERGTREKEREGPRRLGQHREESSCLSLCARLPPADGVRLLLLYENGDINKQTSIKRNRQSHPRLYRALILMNHDGDGDLLSITAHL